jgi:transposase
LALAAIYDGASRRKAAKIGGVGVQTVRDWALAFNGEGPPGLIDGKAPGNQPLLNAEQRAAPQRIVEVGPHPAVDGVVRWRLCWPEVTKRFSDTHKRTKTERGSDKGRLIRGFSAITVSWSRSRR